MAENKTRPGGRSVTAFMNSITDADRRAECRTLIDIMRRETGARPVMWGSSIVGFGSYHYRYASGREGDFFLTGFSPRKQALTVYIIAGFSRYQDLLARLGRHRTGKSCLYLRSLDDVHLPTLRKLIGQSVRQVRERAGKEG
jgi:hypothetical protein